jgi:hypothetical protein
MEKLAEARKVLNQKRGEYLRKFIKDERGRRVLSKPGGTNDDLGQLKTAELTQARRATRLRAMNTA